MSPQSKKRVVRGLVSSIFFWCSSFDFFYIHGLRRFDSLFRISGENDVCDTSPFLAARLPLVLTSVTPSVIKPPVTQPGATEDFTCVPTATSRDTA